MIDWVPTSWAESARWDFKTAKASAFRRDHPHFVRFGEYVEEATIIVDPKAAPEKLWPLYGVNNITGVFLNQFVEGAEFNSRYKGIQKDWFFHNPTRANVGSIGRVPTVEEDAITSPEYQVWRLKKGSGFSADFVEVLIRTPMFLELVKWHRRGAVKERLFVADLLEIPVPPVTPTMQEQIVAKVAAAKERVRQAMESLAQEADGAGKVLAAMKSRSK